MGKKNLLPITLLIVLQVFTGCSNDLSKHITKSSVYEVKTWNAENLSFSNVLGMVKGFDLKGFLGTFDWETEDDDQTEKIKKVITSFQKELHDTDEEIFDLDFEDDSYLTPKAKNSFVKSAYVLSLSKNKKLSRFAGIDFRSALLDVNDIQSAFAEYTVHYEIMDQRGKVLEKKHTKFINTLVKNNRHWQIDKIKILEPANST